MKCITDIPAREDVLRRWEVRDALRQSVEALAGDELFDVMVYGSDNIDISVWLRRDADNPDASLTRERELRSSLPASLFDTWPQRTWKRTLMEFSGDFAYKTDGARAVSGRAYTIHLSLYNTHPQGCTVRKVTKTMEVYESDCKDVDISEDRDNEI